MTLKIRRLIYLTFIALFVVLAPLILLYTAGYRYDFKRNKILKTGGIFLYVKTPTNAQIFLNNELQKETSLLTSEVRINHLLPNQYSLEVTKENYFPWKKNLEVKSGQTTFAEHIILFKKSQPQLLIEGNITILKPSPNEKFLPYLIEANGLTEIWILDLETQKTILLYRSSFEEEKITKNKNLISWSPDSQNMIVSLPKNKEEKEFFIININNPLDPINLTEFINLPIYKLIWSLNNSNFIYGLANNTIYRLNITDKSSIKIADLYNEKNQSGINDFIIKNNAFYYFKTEKNDTFLIKKNIDGGEEEIILRLDPAPYRLMEKTPGNYIIVINENNKEFLLIDLESLTVFLTGTANDFYWSKNGERLLYYNDFEIWFYNVPEKKSELITRYGNEIKQAQWITDFDYIAFLLQDSLNIIELDSRDKRNIYNYAQNGEINNFTVTDDSENIFLSGKLSNQEGIHILNIR